MGVLVKIYPLTISPFRRVAKQRDYEMADSGIFPSDSFVPIRRAVHTGNLRLTEFFYMSIISYSYEDVLSIRSNANA